MKDRVLSFYSQNINKSHLYNILATLASIDSFLNISNFKKDTFLDFEIPSGRGDLLVVRSKNKKINLVDETYNSNPLSLKTAIENYDNIDSKNSKKYMILGDMLELGRHSLKQHKLISKIINKSKINKVYVVGKYIRETFNGLIKYKKAEILNDKLSIINLIDNELNNNDYLMIKGSNSTGLYQIINELKRRNSHVV